VLGKDAAVFKSMERLAECPAAVALLRRFLVASTPAIISPGSISPNQSMRLTFLKRLCIKVRAKSSEVSNRTFPSAT
jgi:hypothetical protein